MGQAKGPLTMKTLCKACLVLVAFRWAEVDCADCARLNAREQERVAA
jgi:hypothetical protein